MTAYAGPSFILQAVLSPYALDVRHTARGWRYKRRYSYYFACLESISSLTGDRSSTFLWEMTLFMGFLPQRIGLAPHPTASTTDHRYWLYSQPVATVKCMVLTKSDRNICGSTEKMKVSLQWRLMLSEHQKLEAASNGHRGQQKQK